MKNLTTQTFGRLTVLRLDGVKRYESSRNTQTKAYWLCRCKCGTQKVVRGEHLVSGRTTSCGCGAKNNASTHGLSKTPEYGSWLSMHGRTRNPVKNHEFYGQIKVCNRWRKFENFIKDMGPKPTPKHSIDRIDPYGNYEPSNCRWATASEQMQNQRRNHELYAKFNSLSPSVPWGLFSQRVRVLGWSPEKAAATPKRKNQFC